MNLPSGRPSIRGVRKKIFGCPGCYLLHTKGWGILCLFSENGEMITVVNLADFQHKYWIILCVLCSCGSGPNNPGCLCKNNRGSQIIGGVPELAMEGAGCVICSDGSRRDTGHPKVPKFITYTYAVGGEAYCGSKILHFAGIRSCVSRTRARVEFQFHSPLHAIRRKFENVLDPPISRNLHTADTCP